jgi:outer membrane protein TolC
VPKVRVMRGKRFARQVLLAAAATMATALMAVGQESTRLSLAEAIDLAKRNNPLYLQTQNDEGAADWAVRQAYSTVFLPTASVTGQASFEAPGEQRIGTIVTGTAAQGALYQSFYSLNLNYQLSGSNLFGLGSARADRKATHARTVAAEFNMEQAVTLQYMVALRARDQVEVAQRQVERSNENWEIANARVAAQAAIVTDAKQAEVQAGRDSVLLLQAESALRVERFRLLENVGLTFDDPVELVSEFDVFAPEWSVNDLLAMALDGHPQLRSFEATEGARRANLRQARSSYFPTISLNARWAGFTQEVQNGEFLVERAENQLAGAMVNCQNFNQISASLPTPLPTYPRNCGEFVLSDETQSAILESNSIFPFNFNNLPFQASLSVNFPIFQGFSREQQVSQAAAAYEDAVHSRRGEELRTRTAVTSAFDGLTTAYQIVSIEVRNSEVAGEQLELARQRYQVGADNFLILLDAERTMADAERAYLDAIYTFHLQLVTLEAAVGQRLRPEDTRRSDGEPQIQGQ